MSSQAVSTSHIAYLEKDFLDGLGGKIDSSALTIDEPRELRLLRIKGISNFWETQKEQFVSLRLFMEDIISGLYEGSIPILFAALGGTDRIDIIMGTFGEGARSGRDTLETLRTALRSSFQGIELEDLGHSYLEEKLRTFPFSGFVTGTPTAKVGDEEKLGKEQIERIIRGLYGREWGYVVIAMPATNEAVNTITASALNEMRVVADSQKSSGTESPIGKRYSEELEIYVKNKLRLAKAQGMWHAAVFLFSSDQETLNHAKALARSVFSGKESIPDPIRTFELEGATREPGLIMNRPPAPPGQFQYPYALMNTVNSADLANFVHLPSQEMPGFQVRPYARFDVSTNPIEASKVELGEILDQGRGMGIPYLTSITDFKKHGLVVGTTGSGKTNTLFHLLIRLWRSRIPFLVLEPAKTEYRSLLASEMGQDLRVFTLGQEQVSPFRANPFEVEPGVSVSTHIDLLKSVFNASFGMWNPLPQVLERSIHAVYRDYGWDPVRDTNERLPSTVEDLADAYPTLTDLYEKVDETVSGLGYEERVTSDIKAALLTRLNSLRIGGKGIMLDAQRSIPIEELLSKPTVVELEQIGDDDEKAFIMGLLLIRIYEHLRAHGSAEGVGLRHVVVVEEAHRLLANVPVLTDQEQSNVRGKAVETFVNMLSEVRAYGQGFLVAEQIPSKLSPDVVKNTNLKIIHRTVAGDDRRTMGEVTNMEERQWGVLSTLESSKGQAVVFAEGDDRPVMISVPYAKIEVPPEMKVKSRSDGVVASHMGWFREQPEMARLYAPFSQCLKACGGTYRYCEDGKNVVGHREFQERFAALVVSLVLEAESLDPNSRQLLAYLRSRLPQKSMGIEAMKCVAMNAARWYFSYFGRRYQWPYDVVGALRDLLIGILLERIPSPGGGPESGDEGAESLIKEFQELYLSACQRQEDPFPSCPIICPSGRCLFRYHSEMLSRDRRLSNLFDAGMTRAGQEGAWKDLGAVEQAIIRLGGTDLPGDARRSMGLCYGVQQVTFAGGMMEVARRMAINELIRSYDEGATSADAAMTGGERAVHPGLAEASRGDPDDDLGRES